MHAGSVILVDSLQNIGTKVHNYNDNIMVIHVFTWFSASYNLFHTDFGHFLRRKKKNYVSDMLYKNTLIHTHTHARTHAHTHTHTHTHTHMHTHTYTHIYTHTYTHAHTHTHARTRTQCTLTCIVIITCISCCLSSILDHVLFQIKEGHGNGSYHASMLLENHHVHVSMLYQHGATSQRSIFSYRNMPGRE